MSMVDVLYSLSLPRRAQNAVNFWYVSTSICDILPLLDRYFGASQDIRTRRGNVTLIVNICFIYVLHQNTSFVTIMAVSTSREVTVLQFSVYWSWWEGEFAVSRDVMWIHSWG
jgi:hypothetical protein